MQEILNFIDGEFVPAADGTFLENIEPATGKVYSQIANGGERDVDRAVHAATRAFGGWSRTSAAERSRLLLEIADRIERKLEDLARAESTDNGKPTALARKVDIPRAAANFRFFATAILHEASEAHLSDHRALNYTLRRPVGVVGAITPWNLPLYLLSWKIAPALAAGNTVVAKPSEITPMTAFRLAEICAEVGVPRGVVNIVQGRGPSAGAALVAHPRVRAISFTGGTETGKAIARGAASRFAKVSLELGGKNPNIIFADADLEQASAMSVHSSFANQGQICLCGSRIFVESSIYDDFLERFIERSRRLRVGDPYEASSDLGALVSRAQLEKVEGFVEAARKEGGRFLCGGTRTREVNERCRDGYFFEPTVIEGLGPKSCVNQQEIFGPVVTVTPFEDEASVVDLANETEYGLSASVWTKDLDRAHRMSERLECGTVWINCWMLRDLRVPFGGMKSSGVGREGGLEALRFFSEAKNVCIRTGRE